MSLLHCQSHCTVKTLSGNFCEVMFLVVAKIVWEEFHISLVICLDFQHILVAHIHLLIVLREVDNSFNHGSQKSTVLKYRILFDKQR